MSYWTGVGAGRFRCCQQTNRNFLKSLRGSLAMGKPSEVVALNIFFRNHFDMKINSLIVKIFGALIVLMHITVVVALLFAIYAKADPETATRLLRSINWMQLANPSFEVIIALIFLLYVVFVGTLSVLLNISQKHDESVEVLNEIRDLLRQSNGDKKVSLNKDLGNWPPSV